MSDKNNWNVEQIKSKLAKREIWINGSIDDSIIPNAIMHVHEWNEQDANIMNPTPIKLFINSPGGHVTTTLALLGVLKESKAEIHTYNMGRAMSGGFLLFLAGDKRFAYKDSTFLMHGCSRWISYSTADNLLVDAEHSVEVNERLFSYIKSRTRIPMKEIKASANVDKYYWGDQAFEKGIVTNLLGS